jgi:hypothetical protein
VFKQARVTYDKIADVPAQDLAELGCRHPCARWVTTSSPLLDGDHVDDTGTGSSIPRPAGREDFEI